MAVLKLLEGGVNHENICAYVGDKIKRANFQFSRAGGVSGEGRCASQKENWADITQYLDT
jgi:hypothetical protein